MSKLETDKLEDYACEMSGEVLIAVQVCDATLLCFSAEGVPLVKLLRMQLHSLSCRSFILQ